ncbi:MAG: DUF4147 domain-containing protein [Chloroflexota bacterium]|nr:DUF4147 domain-containing protein [Chloroflexota bacterium]
MSDVDRDLAGVRQSIEAWFRKALAAVEPGAAVRRHVQRDGNAVVVGGRRVMVPGRLVTVGVGKAAVGMTLGLEAALGDLISDGLVITKDGHAEGERPKRVRVTEAAHPIPDERGVRATREVLDLVTGLGADDVVVALISGGGSALLEAPRPPVTLTDLATVTELLLRAGAPIDDLNAVRTPLSLVKGGGLRRAAGPATVITLLLSDVLGNDPRVIASGPTIPGDQHPERALEILAKYDLMDRVPTSVVGVLRAAGDQERELAPDEGSDTLVVVGDNQIAVGAAARAADADGYRAQVVWSERHGEASDLGRAWVETGNRAEADVDVLLGGGEATVTVRGEGIGGRNTEFALAAAFALDLRGGDQWVVASLATDGQDGPTGVAGAIADSGTVRRARAGGVDPVTALRDNDSRQVFEAAGGLVTPGPTGTNVNDLYVAVRMGRGA